MSSRSIGVVAAGMLSLSACARDSTGPDASGSHVLDPVVLSAPITAGDSGSAVYVSAPPGTVPGARTVFIRNLATGSVVLVAALNGGFDPVAIQADESDSLNVSVTDSAGASSDRTFETLRKRPPVVVRTDPPVRKLDVPLNARLRVGFSEPVDTSSLVAGSIQLLTGDRSVTGATGADPGSAFWVNFVPEQGLAPETDYLLIVTTQVRGMGGEQLAKPDTVAFRTGPAPIQFKLIVAGAYHSCGLALDGIAYCWGSGAAGDLGTGDAVNSSVPRVVVGGLHFSALQAGLNNACGLSEGWWYCWGEGYPPLRVTHPTAVSTPSPTYSAANPGSLRLGPTHACVAQEQGSFACFGDWMFVRSYPERNGWIIRDTTGTLICDIREREPAGTSCYMNPAEPLAVFDSVPVVRLALGAGHDCGLDAAGTAWCLGFNTVGQLGYAPPSGFFPDSFLDRAAFRRARPIVGQPPFTMIVAGWHHTCALSDAGHPYCWGGSDNGRAGAGLGPDPVEMPGGHTFSSLVAGFDFTCGLDAQAAAWCWGVNSLGVFGDGTWDIFGWAAPPVAVAGELRFATLSAGLNHVCGMTIDGMAYCWGDNNYGQLGVGPTPLATNIPLRVAGQPESPPLKRR